MQGTTTRDSLRHLPRSWGVAARYPEGPKVRVDDEWRKANRKWLDEKNMSQTRLAEIVGCSGPAISQLLTIGRGPKTSSLALPVAKVTGISVPGYEDDEEIALFARLAKKLRNRDPHRYRTYEQGLRRLVDQLERIDDETLNTISALDVNISREPRDEAEVGRSPKSRRPTRRG